MKTKIEEMKKAERAAIELLRKEEENKYNALKKKFQTLEGKMKKKEEELEALKNLAKLKQTNFVENLQTLTEKYAEKFTEMKGSLIEKEQEISKLKERVMLKKNTDTSAKETHGKNENLSQSGSKTADSKAENDDQSGDNNKKNGYEKLGGNENDPVIPKAGKEKRKCFQCNTRGHLAKDCPNIDNSKWCTFCSKNSHNIEDCWSKKDSHIVRDAAGKDCSDKDDSKRCTFCSKNDHNTEDCWSKKNQNRKNINPRSKTKNDNLDKKKDNQHKPRGKCPTCSEKGHTAEECNQKERQKLGNKKKTKKDDLKNDQELMSMLLNTVKQWHQLKTQ